jgi:hypothetical protein
MPLGSVNHDAANLGMSVRASQDREIPHSRQLDVANISRLARNQARVFAPPNGLAN